MINGALVRLSFRTLLRSKKIIFAGLVSLLPLIAGIISFIVTGFESNEPYFEYYMALDDALKYFVLAGTIPLVALLLAGGLMADEVEDRTLTYLLSRPINRATLYLSKALPVIAVTSALAVFQVLGLGIMEIATYATYGDGAAAQVWGENGIRATVPMAEAIGGTLMGGLLAALLLSAGLASVFGLVSLLLTRFHFFANLIIYLAWELPFGQAGSQGIGVVTFLHHAISIVERFNPTDTYLDSSSPLWFSIPWMAIWVVAWVAIGATVSHRRDFNITSAAS